MPKMYRWRCPCGNMTAEVRIGTTPDGCLIAVWHCAACDEDVCHRVSIEKLIADFPVPPQQICPPLFSDEDEELLKAMHIVFRKES